MGREIPTLHKKSIKINKSKLESHRVKAVGRGTQTNLKKPMKPIIGSSGTCWVRSTDLFRWVNLGTESVLKGADHDSTWTSTKKERLTRSTPWPLGKEHLKVKLMKQGAMISLTGMPVSDDIL